MLNLLCEYKLLIFGMDGTLVPQDFEKSELIPQVTMLFEDLGRLSLKRVTTPKIAIATNQDGVGLRCWMERDGFGTPQTLPTEEEALHRVMGVASQIRQLYRFPDVYISWMYQSKSSEKWGPVPKNVSDAGWQKKSRKPGVGMLEAAMARAKASPAETLMIGDAASDWEAGYMAECATLDIKLLLKGLSSFIKTCGAQ